MIRKTALAAAILAMTSGCSFLIQDTVPRGWKGKTDPRCDTGYGAPFVDLVFATLDTATIAYIGLENTTIILLLATALWSTSAAAGFHNAGECTEAIVKFADYQATSQKERDREDEDEEQQRREIEEVQRAKIREEERRKLEIEQLRRENEELRRQRDKTDDKSGDSDNDDIERARDGRLLPHPDEREP